MSFRSPISKHHNTSQDFDLFEKNHFSPFLSDDNFSGFRPDHARIHYDNLPFDAFTNGIPPAYSFRISPLPIADLDIQRNSYRTTANNSNDQSNSATFPKSFLTGLGYSPIKLSQGDLPNDILGRKFISPSKSNNMTPIKMFPKSDRNLLQPFGSAERSLLHEVLSSQDFGEDLDGIPTFNWNHDQNKPVLRNVVNQPTYSSARNLNREAQDYNNEFDLKDKLKSIPGIQEKLKTQMVSSENNNKTVKRSSANKKDDFEHLTKDIRAALRKSPKDTAVSTSQGETVSDNDDDEEDLEDFVTDMKGRGSKGLKILSIIVRNILLQKKEATYKEVAQIIYHECGDMFKNGKTLKDEAKDEKNIKRRVYDSLNILVSSGILLRDGKKVRCSKDFLQGRILNKVEFKYKKEQLQNQLMQRKAAKENKLDTLRDLIYKSLAIKNLIQRNKEKEEDPQFSSKKEETSSTVEEEESPEEPSSVKFPFIVIFSPTPDNPIKANLDGMQRELKIDSKDQLSILGDIDILQKLNLHKQVSKEFVDAQIPRALRQYIPKEFLEMLK